MGGHDLVVRLCSPGTELLGIDRATEELATRRAAELGIGPEVLAYLPDVVHVVIISRDVPPLSLSRLRATGALTVIDADAPLIEYPPRPAATRLVAGSHPAQVPIGASVTVAPVTGCRVPES